MNPKTNHLYAANTKVNVITEIDAPADSLKYLLIVPTNSDLEIGKSLNFFNEVITSNQFEDDIIKAGLADVIVTIRNRKGLHKAAMLYRPFVFLEHVYGGKGITEGIRLYDPIREQIIFENSMSTGLFSKSYPDGRSWYPLYNSLLDYLRKQQ